MSAPETIHRLVENFANQRDDYRSGNVKEATIRQEFIDPFFEALGWDLRNIRGHAEAYKDVVVEPSLDVEGETKAPDYAFRVGGTRKFLVEAKKPSVNIESDIYPAFQLRRYTWSAKLPLGILTDFEEFAVYDCRTRPSPKDKPGTDRIMLLGYQDYIEQWDRIASIFSKDAVLKGSFDQFAQASKGKRGTQEVDEEFLKEIEGWRDLLARNLALRNDSLTTPELNYAVQMIIDRIVFLRICEDREIEPHGKLKNLTTSGEIYPNLVDLFRQADKRYNSGLFHFETEKGESTSPDGLTPGLSLDDKVMKDIICSLYYPSPYMFNLIPADILGQIYERFLGKVIRLTAGHQAKVEEKPEVRKAGGVYYTPTYIVDYIVENTVGKLLEGRAPEGAAALKIVDPACGSGSFLLGAYQRLMDWHLDWYSQNDPQKWAGGARPRIYQGQRGEWALTTAEKKRILLNNIHGVDIDPQAVEVTKLSLSLKVLEGENQETIGSQMGLFRERALPDLGHNIQCGNSLIGPDYYDERQLSLLDDEERARVNAFDWHGAFPGVFAQGGFDAVIGNPPYLFITEINYQEKEFYSEQYLAAEYRYDTYALFIEKAIKSLIRERGLVSFIIPHTILTNSSFKNIRGYILNSTLIKLIIDIGPGVFSNARNETMIFVVEKKELSKNDITTVYLTDRRIFPNYLIKNNIHQSFWKSDKSFSWNIKLNEKDLNLISKISSSKKFLIDICTINQGLRTGNNSEYLRKIKADNFWKPAVGGKQIKRYEPLKEEIYVLYDPLLLDAPRNPRIFETPEKIVIQEIRNILLDRRIVATYDNKQFYCLQSTNVINYKKKDENSWPMFSLLGLINSNLINYFFKKLFAGNNHIASNQLAKIPLPDIDQTSVSLIYELAKKLYAINGANFINPPESKKLTNLKLIIEKQIDDLVYEAFHLTDDEISLVETK